MIPVPYVKEVGEILLYIFMTHVYQPLELLREDWLKIAQFEVVMLNMHVPSQKTQSQIPGEIAYSWYYIVECHVHLRTNKKIKFVDTLKSYPFTMPRDKLLMAELEIVKLQQQTRQLII